jgi:hypothetical protein
VSYTIHGTYEGEPAMLQVEAGTDENGLARSSGWPTSAVIAAKFALFDLAQSGRQVPGIPTGPFNRPETDQAKFLTLLRCLDYFPEVVGDAP